MDYLLMSLVWWLCMGSAMVTHGKVWSVGTVEYYKMKVIKILY